ncbi:unnamed protein product, partial [Scytosiphon promiscuus]
GVRSTQRETRASVAVHDSIKRGSSTATGAKLATMRRHREICQLSTRCSSVVSKSAPWRRLYSEYAPAAPSPNDLKAPLPEKFSVGKNLKLKAVLFQYDVLAGSSSKQTAAPVRSSTSSGTAASASSPAASRSGPGFQPLSPSGEQLVDEITGVLGKAGGKGNRFQEMSRTLIADLKDKMGATGRTPPPAHVSSGGTKQQPANGTQDSDPKAKYLEKLRKKTGGGTSPGSPGAATASSQRGGDADLFAARNLVSVTEKAKLQSAWMLRQGAGDLLTYLAARSVRLGVIAGPSTTQNEFESFVQQLRQQSIRVTAAISPEALGDGGVEAGVARASRELVA